MLTFFSTYLQLILLVLISPFLLILYPLLKLIALAKPKIPLKTPKVIVITGASSGIGAAFAKHYAKKGIVLGLTGRDKERLAAVAAECETKGAKVVQGVLSVTDRKEMDTWLKSLDDQYPVDLIIANAGVTVSTAGTQGNLEETARQAFGTNVDGSFNTIFPLLERMRQRKSGQIALMSSMSAFGPSRGMFEYCSSKAALKIFAEAFRWLLYRDGVHVNALVPGFFHSPMTDVNKGAMPFKIPLQTALDAMVQGLASDQAVITVPWSFYTASWFLLHVLPEDCRDALARTGISRLIQYHGKRQHSKTEKKDVQEVSTNVRKKD